jgi:hypothetical protein
MAGQACDSRDALAAELAREPEGGEREAYAQALDQMKQCIDDAEGYQDGDSQLLKLHYRYTDEASAHELRTLVIEILTCWSRVPFGSTSQCWAQDVRGDLNSKLSALGAPQLPRIHLKAHERPAEKDARKQDSALDQEMSAIGPRLHGQCRRLQASFLLVMVSHNAATVHDARFACSEALEPFILDTNLPKNVLNFLELKRFGRAMEHISTTHDLTFLQLALDLQRIVVKAVCVSILPEGERQVQFSYSRALRTHITILFAAACSAT